MADTDVRITPLWLVQMVREFAAPLQMHDACTEADNPIGADSFYSLALGQDGLVLPWSGTTLNWCNMPFSDVMPWAVKAASEARLGRESVLITKDDSRPKWNEFLRGNADVRCRIQRGVGFAKPDESGAYVRMVGPMWGHALWYFGTRRRRFDRVFSPIGEVTHLLGLQE